MSLPRKPTADHWRIGLIEGLIARIAVSAHRLRRSGNLPFGEPRAQRTFQRQPDKLTALPHARLGEQALKDVLYRTFGEIQVVANLAGSQPIHNALDNLLFAFFQNGRPSIRHLIGLIGWLNG